MAARASGASIVCGKTLVSRFNMSSHVGILSENYADYEQKIAEKMMSLGAW